ncbi:MAG: alpha/beta hydrolase [Terrimonas sp.]|nr:alpha/beta hydrolase [Terrimonas sp.]
MKFILVILLIVYSISGNAQYPTVDMPGTATRNIISSIVSGQEYVLHIALPAGYNNLQKKYPVIYLMDSQWDFPLVKSIYGEQYYDGFIPEMIIVGVTWGGNHPNPDSLRARDYTPTKEMRLPQSGGADLFLSFMKNELFPFIESSYRADPEKRVLMGCSLGGLFTLYALFTQPDLFMGYAAASPAIGWDQGVISRYEKGFKALTVAKPKRLYMTVGDVERGRMGFEQFSDRILLEKHKNLLMQSRVLENTGHSGTKNETYARGLQYLFERPSLQLSETLLDMHCGLYASDDGNRVQIKKQGNWLILFLSDFIAYPLQAASENDFYSTAEFLNTRFTKGNNLEDGLIINRYGSNLFYKKIK